jgi:hypothetical protein
MWSLSAGQVYPAGSNTVWRQQGSTITDGCYRRIAGLRDAACTGSVFCRHRTRHPMNFFANGNDVAAHRSYVESGMTSAAAQFTAHLI